MSLVEMYHARHKNFHAKIAARSVPDAPQPKPGYFIPNTPYGVPKIDRNEEPAWYHCMWFFDLIQPRIATPRYTSVSVELIQRAVCTYFNKSRIDLLSARRTKDLTVPRQIAMYLSKTLTKRSLPEIGRRFGDRDHTTVLHNVRKITNLIESDPDIAADVATIRRSLPGVG